MGSKTNGTYCFLSISNALLTISKGLGNKKLSRHEWFQSSLVPIVILMTF